MALEHLMSAAVESDDDIDARIKTRREKWQPLPGGPEVTQGDATARIVVKVGGTTEQVEVERPNGRFSSYTLGDSALVHEVAEQYDALLAEQAKSAGK